MGDRRIARWRTGVEELRSFNIVLAGSNFPVQQIELDDFSFLGRPLRPGLRIPVALQAVAGEFRLEVFEERLQVSVVDASATPDKIGALQEAARTFINEYAGRKAITAVGHNFQGTATTQLGSGAELLKRLTWRRALAGIIASTTDPVPSLGVRFRRGFETTSLLRLEASIDDTSRFFYDLNFSFSMLGEEGQAKFSVLEALDAFNTSLAAGTEIVEGLSQLSDETLPEEPAL
jgi:hypothetical protein